MNPDKISFHYSCPEGSYLRYNGLYIAVPKEIVEKYKSFTLTVTNWKSSISGRVLPILILKGIVDWGSAPSSSLVGNVSDAVSSQTFNLYDLWQSNQGYYTANDMYICIVDYTTSSDNGATFSFDVSLRSSETIGSIIATGLTEEYEDQLEERLKDSIENAGSSRYITCWGDSLTAGGGWTKKLQELSGLTVYNGGTGGENAQTIFARQGGDIMITNNITIPASNSESVVIASRSADTGILTQEGNRVTPLLQGGAHVNPVKVGDVEGTLSWTGSSYNDQNGTWTFTRKASGDSITVDRPTAIRTEFDRNKNSPYLMIIFMGQNQGYSSNEDLVRMHRRMIDHAHAENVIVLGLSSGTKSSRADYEALMKKEFGRYFISLREYLSTPIYDDGGETIISCYGLADQGLSIDPNYSYSGKTTLQEIEEGSTPHQILADSVHYTTGTKEVIGKLIYKRCCELNIF